MDITLKQNGKYQTYHEIIGISFLLNNDVELTNLEGKRVFSGVEDIKVDLATNTRENRDTYVVSVFNEMQELLDKLSMNLSEDILKLKNQLDLQAEKILTGTRLGASLKEDLENFGDEIAELIERNHCVLQNLSPTRMEPYAEISKEELDINLHMSRSNYRVFRSVQVFEKMIKPLYEDLEILGNQLKANPESNISVTTFTEAFCKSLNGFDEYIEKYIRNIIPITKEYATTDKEVKPISNYESISKDLHNTLNNLESEFINAFQSAKGSLIEQCDLMRLKKASYDELKAYRDQFNKICKNISSDTYRVKNLLAITTKILNVGNPDPCGKMPWVIVDGTPKPAWE